MGRTKIQKSWNDLRDFLYVIAGLSFATIYTFRVSDSISIDAEYVAHLLFPKSRTGVQRARNALDMMVDEELISADSRTRYLITRDLSELASDDELFIWISLEDFNTIKEKGDRLAPDLFSFYVFLLSTRNGRLDWVAGDKSGVWIADALGITQRTVSKYSKLLQDMHVLYVKPRPPKFGVNQTNIYGSYADKDKIDQLVVETVRGSKRGFKISVTRRYDEVLQRDGADYTVAELEKLIEDAKEYNRLIEKAGTGERKNLLLLEEIRDRLVDEAAIDAQVEEEFNSKYGYGGQEDDHDETEPAADEDEGITYSTHEDGGYDGPDMSGQKIRTPEEEARIDEIGRQQWMEGYMQAMQEWEEKHKSDKRPSDEELAMIENESYDPRENYDDWSPTPEGRKHLSAMGIVEPAEDEDEYGLEDDEIEALFR